MKKFVSFALGVPCIVCTIVVMCVGMVCAGTWSDVSQAGSESMTNNTHRVSGQSPVKYYTSCVPSSVGELSGEGGKAKAWAWARIRTLGTWTGSYSYSTPTVTASFDGAMVKEHSGTPSHSDVQGIYRASGKIRASFEAECSVRTDAEGWCGGSSSANISIAGNTGNAEVSGVNVGCDTSGKGYPIGFTVGGTVGGTGATLGVTSSSTASSIYNSGLIFREYLFSTPETSTHFTSLRVDYSGSASAKAGTTATPGYLHSSDADATMDVEAEVSDVMIEVVCPPEG